MHPNMSLSTWMQHVVPTFVIQMDWLAEKAFSLHCIPAESQIYSEFGIRQTRILDVSEEDNRDDEWSSLSPSEHSTIKLRLSECPVWSFWCKYQNKQSYLLLFFTLPIALCNIVNSGFRNIASIDNFTCDMPRIRMDRISKRGEHGAPLLHARLYKGKTCYQGYRMRLSKQEDR